MGVIARSTIPSTEYNLAFGMRTRVAMIAAWILIFQSFETMAEDVAPGVSLEELERRAVETFPEVRAAEARVKRLEAELSEIRWRPFSDVSVDGFVAPTPERRGDAVHSAQDDLSFSGDMGVIVRAGLDISIPLYTFGRLPAERRAARERIEVGREDVRSTCDGLRRQVQRAYYAMLLAKVSHSLLEEGQGYITRAQKFIDNSLDEDDGMVTESQRLQVKVLEAEVEARLSEARRAEALAMAALKILGGLEADETVATPYLEPIPLKLEPLERYIESARGDRPEIKASKARERESKSLERAARARYFPELRLDGDLSYAYSNVVDDQLTPFANDPANYFRYGVGLSLRWDLDFMTDRARVRQANAKVREREALSAETGRRVTLDVEQAYIDVESYQKLVSARRRGRSASRGWLFSIMQGIDIGVLEPPELVDALRAYFEQNFLYYEAVARLDTAIGALRIASTLENGDADAVEGEAEDGDSE